MDYLTFISEQLFSATPRIDGSVEGLWRLEESRHIDCDGDDEVVNAYVPYIAENFCLDVRHSTASFYNDCRLCPGDAPRCCPSCNTRDYFPYTFDPKNGLFICRDEYYLVRRLSSKELQMLELGELGELGRGVVASCHYSRIG